MSITSSQTLMFLSLKYSQWREMCRLKYVAVKGFLQSHYTTDEYFYILWQFIVFHFLRREKCLWLSLDCYFYCACSIWRFQEPFSFSGVHIWWKRNLRNFCIEHTLLPTRLLILIHVKHTIPYLDIQLSSWRWTLGFETCRRHKEN